MAGTKITDGNLGASRDLDAKIPQSGASTPVTSPRQILAAVENVQTDNYTLVITDAYNTVVMNKGTAVNLTVPPNSSVAFVIGSEIKVRRIGAGQLTFVQGSGVTITSSLGALTDPAQNALMLLTKTGTNAWYLDNSTPNNAVPTTRTLAGLDLSADRTSSVINVALGLKRNFLLKGSTNNRFYGTAIAHGTPTTATLAAGTLKATPLTVEENVTIDTIQAEVSTFAANAKLRLGIYADNGSGYPGTLIVDSGELDAGSNGVKAATISAALTPGIYWLACLGGTANSIYRAETSAAESTIMGWIATMGATVFQSYYTVAQVYGALPNPFTASATINATGTNIPVILVRAA